MPHLDCGDSLIRALFEVGPTLPGATPLSYQEIESWANLTGTNLTPWEVVTLKELSLVYVLQLSKREIHEPAPFYNDNRTVDQQRSDVMSKFKAASQRSKK